MAKAIKRPAESWVYVLMRDLTLDLGQQSRFTLRPMTHAERAAVRDDIARTQEAADGSTITLMRTRQQGYSIALSHIVSIENFPSDAPKPWPTDANDRAAYLEQLADDDVLELGNEVWARSALGADGPAIKNFSTPERTSSSGDGDLLLSTTAVSAPSSPA